MEQARMDRAMKRIEDALARIEAGAKRPPQNASETPGGNGESYNKLRGEVTGTLRELDRLIADLER